MTFFLSTALILLVTRAIDSVLGLIEQRALYRRLQAVRRASEVLKANMLLRNIYDIASDNNCHTVTIIVTSVRICF
jgi:hypothetical protein